MREREKRDKERGSKERVKIERNGGRKRERGNYA